MAKPLTGKVVLVTGGSRGIGAATASVLAERGFRVVANYRASAPQAEEVVAAISAAGGEAVAIQADVTAPGDVAGMVGEIDQRWGGVDVLVHNALIPFAITSFAELTWEQLNGKLDRELRAAFLITKAVGGRLRDNERTSWKWLWSITCRRLRRFWSVFKPSW